MQLDDLVLELLRDSVAMKTPLRGPKDHCEGVRETGEAQVAPAGWGVAAFDVAAAGFDGLGDALGFVVEATCSAEVEDLGLAAEDGGDDPGFAGQPAGGAGGDGFAGVEVGGFEAAHQGLDRDQDHGGGVEAAGFGEALGRVALDEFDEGVAEPLGGGAAFAEGSLVAWCLGAAIA